VRDYFKKTEYVLERLWFHYLGGLYEGRGIMTWNPDEGFHIEAFLDREGQPLPKEIPLGKVGIPRKRDFCSIRMMPTVFDWAIAPKVRLTDRHDVLVHKRLSINLSRVIFSSSWRNNNGLNWCGSALYETKRHLAFPDRVDTEVRINKQKVESKLQASGIWYENEQNQRIIGRLIEDRYLELHWGLSKPLWSKTDSCQWSEAAQYALSIFFGETVWLLQREVRRGARRYIEVRKRERLNSLSFSLFDEQKMLDKRVFIQLTEFLVRNKRHATICRNIFTQMLEASRQQTWQATELLLSTILEQEAGVQGAGCKGERVSLAQKSPAAMPWSEAEQGLQSPTSLSCLQTEGVQSPSVCPPAPPSPAPLPLIEAALRSIDGHPFRPKKDSWNVGKSLTQFFENYLSDEWRPLHSEVMKAHTYLRDRNAHPDWLFSQGGYLSEEEMEKSLDAMIFLSRFYGYMILALAGFKELEPRFPIPHKEWKPLMTIGYLEDSEVENSLSE
jgi:hypothetical protein